MRTSTLVFVLCARLFACDCTKLSVCYIVDQAPVIFIGEVIDGGVASLAEDPWYSDAKHARFRVIEAFRGLSPDTKTVDVELRLWAGMCSPIPYYPGKRYLVTPSQQNDGRLVDGSCFSGEDIENAAERVRYIRDYFNGKMPANVHGRAVTARDTDAGFVDYLVRTGETKLLEGVRVTAAKGSDVYSTVTDASGKYFLPLPGPGSYSVRALLPPFKARQPTELSVSANGCVILNFGLRVDNTISGKVVNQKGEYVEYAQVSLVDIESRSGKPLARSRVVGEGQFRFEHVPPGRYLIAINPEGPNSDFPFETTYYPLASTRESAKIVEINGNYAQVSGLNLILGPKVVLAFRQISIKVVFEDGTLMKTAFVSCSALAAGPVPGRNPCSRSNAALPRDTFKFEAPANVPVRIEVVDRYGRELGATYAAEFPAGSTPISHEFRIKQ